MSPQPDAQRVSIPEQTLQAMLSAIADLIFVFDSEGRFTFHSAPAGELLLSPEEFLDKKHSEVMPLETDGLFADAFLKNRRGEVAEYDYSLEISGEERWYSVKLSPIFEQDQFAGSVAVVRDIDERKRAQEELRESEERYRTLFESSREGIIITGSDGKIVSVNRATAAILGYESADELVGRDARELYADPQDREALLDKLLRDGYIENYEVALLRKDGAPIDLFGSGTVLRDGKGNVIGLWGIFSDISQRKKAEEALRASEAKYRWLVENLEEGIWVIDKDAYTTLVNPRMAEMLGYAEPEMLGRHLFEFMDEQGIEICKRNLGRRQRGISEKHDFEFRRKDGGRMHATLATSPILDEEGSYAGAIAGVSDVTERVKAEQHARRQRGVMDGTNRVLQEALTCESDADVARVFLAVGEQLTGSKFGFVAEISSPGRMDTTAISDPGWQACRVPESDAVLMVNDLEIRGIRGRVFDDGRSLISNAPALHPDWVAPPEGHPEITAFLGVPLKSGGKTFGMIGLANKEAGYDLTDQEDIETLAVAFVEALMRKRAELELREHRERLEELVRQRTEKLKAANEELAAQQALSVRSDRLRSLGEMAAGIAHELNQPLAGLRAFAEHVLIGLDRNWDVTEDEIRENLTSILEQADRMTHIIHHVRTFAREAGKEDVQPVQVNEVASSSADMLREQFRAHGLTLDCELAEGLPEVIANPFSLEEALLNLLLNARDAVEAKAGTTDREVGSVVLLRTLARQTEGKQFVAIEVVDQGVGMPESVLKRALDPFYTTKGPDKGTGLGLAISQSIVEGFSGAIEIDSVPGEGTKVTMSLPAADN